MKLFHLNITLVALNCCSVIGGTQFVNKNEYLREMIESLQETVESLKVTFDLTFKSSPARCNAGQYWSIWIKVTDAYQINFNFCHTFGC